MKPFDYEAVEYDGAVYCVECLEDACRAPKGYEHQQVTVDSDEVSPIFADSEWDYAPSCDACGAIHDYMTILPADENDDDDDDTPAYPPKRTDHSGTRAYAITLTAEEFRSADYMSARGYLGEITERASDTEWSEDESTVTLRFTEPAAWDVRDVCESDPDAVWALTTPSTSLGEKFQTFLDAIV